MSIISSKPEIEFSEFLEIEGKLDIRIPKSEKLLKLEVSFGSDKTLTVVTNIGGKIQDSELKLKFEQFPFIMNLKPSKMMGIVSEAMIMVVENENGEIELPERSFCKYSNGSKLM